MDEREMMTEYLPVDEDVNPMPFSITEFSQTQPTLTVASVDRQPCLS